MSAIQNINKLSDAAANCVSFSLAPDKYSNDIPNNALKTLEKACRLFDINVINFNKPDLYKICITNGNKFEVLEGNKVLFTVWREYVFPNKPYYIIKKTVTKELIQDKSQNKALKEALHALNELCNQANIKDLYEPAKDDFIIRAANTEKEAAPVVVNSLLSKIKEHLPAIQLCTIMTLLYVLADTTGVIRNAIGLVMDVGEALSSPWFVHTVTVAGQAVCQATLILGQAIAVFRIVQGAFSLILGIIKLCQAVNEFNQCKATDNHKGMAAARLKMANAVIGMLTGALWLTVGIIFLSNPHAALFGIAFTILQWALFYGLFSLDSIISIAGAKKNMQSIDKFHGDDIFNSQLSNHEKIKILKRIVDKSCNITAIQYAKIKAKASSTVDPEELEKNQRAKNMKKLQLASGWSDEQIENITNSKLDGSDLQILIDDLSNSFEKNKAEQKAAIFLSVVCLIVNVMSLPMDIPKLAGMCGYSKSDELSKYMTLGIGSTISWIVNDLLWVKVNALYGVEDKFGAITRLIKRINLSSKPELADSSAKIDPAPMPRFPDVRGDFF